jgi:hypothetical protein
MGVLFPLLQSSRDMAQAFDAYQAWLGIPPAESAGGLNHYRLLGLLQFESNPVVIENAATRTTAKVREQASGPYQLVAQRVLGEIAAARQVLLDSNQKAAYDRELQARIRAGQSGIGIAAPATPVAAAPVAAGSAMAGRPVAASLPVAAPLNSRTPAQAPIVVQVPLPAPAAAPMPRAAPQSPTFTAAAQPETAIASGSASAVASAAGPAPAPRGKSAGFNIPQPVKIVLGGAAGLAMGYFLVYFLTGRDLIGILPPRSVKKNTQVASNKSPQITNLGVGGTQSGPPSSYRPSNRQITSPGQTNFPNNTPITPTNPFAANANSGTSGQTNSETPGETSSGPETVLPPSNNPQTPASNPNNPLAPGTSITPGTNNPVGPLINTAPLPGTTPEPETLVVRRPAPSVDEQKAMLAELQSIYEAEFERGSKPDGRQEFIAFCLSAARKLKETPVAQFVLCREAYDRAMRLEQFITAAEVIDELERGFELDGYRFRMHLLTEASRTAKTPDEKVPLLQFALEMADHALATQQADEVAKLANMAESLARNVPNREVKATATARCAELRKEVEELAPVIAARQRLAADPADPAACLVVGRRLCFVDGDWAEGLKLLAQSEHPSLGAVAKLDLETKPDDRQAAAAIGDAWFELAGSDASLAPAYARASYWYEQALAGSDGLQKVKLEKRIEQVAAMNLPKADVASSEKPTPKLASAKYLLTRLQAFEATDLMEKMNEQTVRTQGWSIYSSSLRVDDNAQWARLQSPVNPTGEYQTALRLTRYGSSSSSSSQPPKAGVFVVGLPSLRSQFLVVLDYPIPGKGYASFLTLSGYKKLEDNPTFKISENLSQCLADGREKVLVCGVKLQEVVVTLDGEKLIEYRGDMGKLTMTPEWAVPNTRSMFLGAHQGDFYIRGWSVAPLVDDNGRELPLLTEPLNSRYGPRPVQQFP